MDGGPLHLERQLPRREGPEGTVRGLAPRLADPERPLEVLRTVHCFDPCLACAIHTLDLEGKEIARVKAL